MTYRIDTQSRTIEHGGITIKVTVQQMALLLRLTKKPGITVTRDALVSALYMDADEPGDGEAVVALQMRRLRNKMDAVGMPHPFCTVFGTGYVFHAPVAFSDRTVISLTAAVLRELRVLVSTHPNRSRAAIVAEALA